MEIEIPEINKKLGILVSGMALILTMILWLKADGFFTIHLPIIILTAKLFVNEWKS